MSTQYNLLVSNKTNCVDDPYIHRWTCAQTHGVTFVPIIAFNETNSNQIMRHYLQSVVLARIVADTTIKYECMNHLRCRNNIIQTTISNTCEREPLNEQRIKSRRNPSRTIAKIRGNVHQSETAATNVTEGNDDRLPLPLPPSHGDKKLVTLVFTIW